MGRQSSRSGTCWRQQRAATASAPPSRSSRNRKLEGEQLTPVAAANGYFHSARLTGSSAELRDRTRLEVERLARGAELAVNEFRHGRRVFANTVHSGDACCLKHAQRLLQQCRPNTAIAVLGQNT